VRRRAHLPELRLELEQRLQILLGNPLVGELGRDGVQAFEPERELVLALGAMPARLPQRFQRGVVRSTEAESVRMVSFQQARRLVVQARPAGIMPREGKELARLDPAAFKRAAREPCQPRLLPLEGGRVHSAL
jgi:hypothetical protein